MATITVGHGHLSPVELSWLILPATVLPNARRVEIEGGPYVICVTHRDRVTPELCTFLDKVTATTGASS